MIDAITDLTLKTKDHFCLHIRSLQRKLAK